MAILFWILTGITILLLLARKSKKPAAHIVETTKKITLQKGHERVKTLAPDILKNIEQAVRSQQVIRINHNDFERDIEPYKITDKYLYGWCRYKKEPRSFRLDSISECKLLEDNFKRDVLVAEYLGLQETAYHETPRSFNDWKAEKNINRMEAQGLVVKPLRDKDAEEAKKQRKRLWIKYVSHDNEVTERKIDVYHSAYGQVCAWCNLRNEGRTFKLNQIIDWRITDETFKWDKKMSVQLRNRIYHC